MTKKHVIREIPSIPGAYARDDGMVKFPECTARMPHGGVRKYKTKWIKGTLRKSAKAAAHVYYGTYYRGRNYKVHRLICEAFHGNPPNENSVVIHINEDATDNRPENLRWGTQKENLNMPRFITYCRSRTGCNHPFVKHRLRKK